MDYMTVKLYTNSPLPEHRDLRLEEGDLERSLAHLRAMAQAQGRRLYLAALHMGEDVPVETEPFAEVLYTGAPLTAQQKAAYAEGLRALLTDATLERDGSSVCLTPQPSALSMICFRHIDGADVVCLD